MTQTRGVWDCHRTANQARGGARGVWLDRQSYSSPMEPMGDAKRCHTTQRRPGAIGITRLRQQCMCDLCRAALGEHVDVEAMAFGVACFKACQDPAVQRRQLSGVASNTTKASLTTSNEIDHFRSEMVRMCRISCKATKSSAGLKR